MSTTLPEIQAQLITAQAECETAMQLVCKLAQEHPEGLAAVATLNGFRREMEALRKIELDLITHGKPAT